MMSKNDHHQIDLLKLIKSKSGLKKLSEYHPSDIAEYFLLLDDDAQKQFMQKLDPKRLAPILAYPDPLIITKVFKMIPPTLAANILIEMEIDDATDIMKPMTSKEKSAVFNHMPKAFVDNLKQLIDYQEETAGSIMTTDFISLQKGMDVKDAMRELIANAKTTEGIQRLFVLDEAGVLEGIIELKKLIQARAPKKIEDLMFVDFITVKEDDHTEEVARLIQNYGMYLLPVVDENKQLKGVITMDDAADILDQETDEDYARFATISPEESVNRSVLKSAFHRLPWLTLLLALGLIVSAIIGGFEDTIAQITALVFFQPLILGMAGNTGTQSLAVTVRGLSKNYFQDFTSAKTHVFKELKVGVLNGMSIGVFSFTTTTLFLTVLTSIDFIALDHAVWLIAMTVGMSAAIALSMASVFGAIIPLTLHKLKVDPAVASGPFITTLNDILGLVVYFTIAAIVILGIWGA